jgi:hypothetical protein
VLVLLGLSGTTLIVTLPQNEGHPCRSDTRANGCELFAIAIACVSFS